MPATWTAQKSHGLTLPKRHALCRMGTRRRDRALFLVRTVRRVTLVVLTACLAAALAGHRGATAAEPPGVLQYLAGCFEVSYRFVEDGVHDKDIRGDLLEEITLASQEKTRNFVR
jgi:hypothetical protein